MFDPNRTTKYLLSSPSETEYIEFKENNSNHEVIGESISALSNAACLAGVEHGYLVYGIENKTHKVVGTKFNPKKTKVGNEDLELWLRKMLDPSIEFSIHEYSFERKPLVIFRVPACIDRPIHFKSQAYIRIGSNTRNLRDFPEKESNIWNFSLRKGYELAPAASELSGNEVLELIDYPSYFSLTGQPLPGSGVEILRLLESENFIKNVGGVGYSITNLGAILFASDLSRFPNLKRKAPRVVIYSGVDKKRTQKEKEGNKGYAIGFEGLIDFINDQLPSNEEITKAFRVENKIYPEIAIRELVANALIHQDLVEKGTGPTIEIFMDRIEISNPGQPLVEVDRLLDSPPQSRNEKLASFMRRVGVCEERGSGIDKVLSSVEVFQLPPPKFEAGKNYFRVSLYSPRNVKDMNKQDRLRACYQHASLRYVANQNMTNSSLRERFKLKSTKTDRVFASNLIADAMKSGLVKPIGDPNARRSAKYVPYWA